MDRSIRVVVAGQRRARRARVCAHIARQSDLAVVGVADDPFRAVELVTRHVPDVVVLDAPGRCAPCIELITRIRAVSPDVRILVLTPCQESAHQCTLLHAGADGCLAGQSTAARLTWAVRTVGTGGSVFSDAVLARIRQAMNRSAGTHLLMEAPVAV